MRTLSAAAFVILATGTSLAAGAQRPGGLPMFKSATDLVTVSVIVRTRDGQPVAGLTRKDFELIDAGQPRVIDEFRAEPAPVSVAVLVDSSGSMAIASKLESARDMVRQLLSWLQPGTDEAALFGFDTRLLTLAPFTTAPEEVADRLGALRAFGSTSLYDATAAAAQAVVAHGGTRHAMVVITDGMDTTSRLTPADVTNVARLIDVPVYVVEVVSPLDHPGAPTAVVPGPLAAPPDKLIELARLTGGEGFVASGPSDQSAAARQVVTELRGQYLLGFTPSADAGWHSLDVRVKHRDLVVRARSGYLAGGRIVAHQSASHQFD